MAYACAPIVYVIYNILNFQPLHCKVVEWGSSSWNLECQGKASLFKFQIQERRERERDKFDVKEITNFDTPQNVSKILRTETYYTDRT